MMTWRRRLQLIFFGYSEAEIAQLGDLDKLTNEQMDELIHSRNLETTEKKSEELFTKGTDITVLDVHVVRKP